MSDNNETTTGFYGESLIEVYDGHTDSALCLRDVSGYTYRIGTLPLKDGMYTFTVWAKAMHAMAVNVEVLGAHQVFELTGGEWTQLTVQNEHPDKDEDGNVVRYIDITPYYEETGEGIDNRLYLYHAMLELSDRASDWSPAPEDDETEIATLTERVTELKLDEDSIVATVTSSETYQNDLSVIREEASTRIKEEIGAVNIEFENIRTMASETESYIESQKTWQRFTPDGFEIGKEEEEDGHQFLMNLSNRELAFRDNGTKVAYINDQVMHITNAEVSSQLTLGNFVFAPTETGMALLYVG